MIASKKFEFTSKIFIGDYDNPPLMKHEVELIIEGSNLDSDGNLLNFNLLHNPISDIIVGFHNSDVLGKINLNNVGYSVDEDDDGLFRFIVCPIEPRLEGLSIVLHHFIKGILENSTFSNGESPDLIVNSVIVRNEKGEMAQAFPWDLEIFPKDEKIYFSKKIKSYWKHDWQLVSDGLGTIEN
jgi:hypothetical protein